MQANVTPIRPNTPSFDSLMQTAAELGAKSGQSKDAQIQFDLCVIEGAFLGALSLEADKHGKGIDDATKLSEAYVKSRNKTAIFDAKADSMRKLCSTTRKCVKAGVSPKYGRGQPMQTVQEFVNYWRQQRQIPAEAKKLDDIHNALMRFLTAQLKSNSLLPDIERNRFAYKNAKDPKSEVDMLEDARKKLRKSGDLSQQVKDAIDNITLRLANIAKGL